MASQEPTFYLLKRRLPAEETPHMLGRIVLAFQDPTLSYAPAAPTLVFPSLPSHVQETADHDVVLHASTSRDANLSAKLQGLLSLTSSRDSQNQVSVESPLVITRRLKNVDEVWAALRSDPAVAAKVREMVGRQGRAYLVTGIMTVRAGRVQRAGMRQNATSASARVPLGDAATAAAGLPGIGTGIGSGLDIGASQGNAVDWVMAGGVGKGSGEAAEEEIFAIEYKMLKRDWARMGREVKLQHRVPDFKGGSTYAGADDDDDEDDDDEETQDADAETIDNVSISKEPFYSGTTVAGQKPRLDDGRRFVYFT